MGLLLLRGFVSVMLISQAVSEVEHIKGPLHWILVGVSFASAACLLAGFMTPLIAVTIVTVEVIFALTGMAPIRVEVIILAIVIALLGPGAFSLDARMFGRREILVPNTSRTSKS